MPAPQVQRPPRSDRGRSPASLMAMRIFRSLSAPPTRGDPATFAGTVSVQRLAEDDAAVPVAVYRVTFSDAGRTNWHSHSGPQWLFVIEGRIRVQRYG